MSRTNDCHSFQLIDGEGEFNDEGLQEFITATNLLKCGVDYAVVAIIGPQSGGKSTFLNHFGGTSFKEMNSRTGSNQTTQGIWISNCVTIQRPFTIAMDIEGTDGVERGEDTAFEGHSALFGLAVADTLIINVSCQDIGKKTAACKTLLQTVLKMRMRMQMEKSRKVKLCFLLRDKIDTEPEILEEQVNSSLKEMWTEITRSNGLERANVSDFFHVLVFSLPHYKYERKEFEDEVAAIREKLLPVDNREGVLPAVAFQENAQRLWKSIKEEPLLNLPAHSEMIAEYMCKENANTCFNSLTSSESLMELKKEVEAGPVNVPGFGDKLHSLMEATLSKYRSEAQHFKESKVSEREEVLKSQILEIFHPLYVTMLGHARNKTFQEFKEMLTKLQMEGVAFVGAYKQSYNSCKGMFEDQCEDVVKKLSAGSWLNLRYYIEVGELYSEMENYASSIRSDSIARLEKKYQYVVAHFITTSLDQPQDFTGDTYWEWMGEIIRMSTSKDNAGPLSNLSSEVAIYSEDISLSDMMIQNLKTYARNDVLRKLKEEDDEKVVERMMNRFGAVVLTKTPLNNKEVAEAANQAWAEALKLLSVMAVVQIDEISSTAGLLFSSLMDENSSTTCSLDTNICEGVSEDDTIIAPLRCKSLRSQFDDASNEILKNVISDVKKMIREDRNASAIQFARYVLVGDLAIPAAGILGAVLVGDLTCLAGSVPAAAFFNTWVLYFKKEEDKARQRATELQKSSLECLQKFIQGGQSSEEESDMSDNAHEDEQGL